jgi:hypothetical protein
MRNAHFFVVALVGLGACSDNPVSPRGPAPDALGSATLAAVASTTSDVVPIDILAFVPCADGGAGELVQASGSLHVVITTVTDATGGILVRALFQPQGLVGVGLTTGDKYPATGGTQSTDRLGTPLPAVITFINNFRFIGAGPDNNLLVHEELHVTINENGVVTVDDAKFSVACQ